jgi:hypothetical protein
MCAVHFSKKSNRRLEGSWLLLLLLLLEAAFVIYPRAERARQLPCNTQCLDNID